MLVCVVVLRGGLLCWLVCFVVVLLVFAVWCDVCLLSLVVMLMVFVCVWFVCVRLRFRLCVLLFCWC